LKQIKDENKKIIENYSAERTLRKKYYNMVEDMKGMQNLISPSAICSWNNIQSNNQIFLGHVNS